MVNNN
jgi:hypothetical protein